MPKKTKGSPKVSFRCHNVLRELMILASGKEGIDLGEWIRRACISSLGKEARKIDPVMGMGLASASPETRVSVSSKGGKSPKSRKDKGLGSPKESAEK